MSKEVKVETTSQPNTFADDFAGILTGGLSVIADDLAGYRPSYTATATGADGRTATGRGSTEKEAQVNAVRNLK